MKVDVEERVKRGMDYFKNGYNCSQAVVSAFADIYNLDSEMALRIAASFGGGMGRMRLTCGAVSGMFILAGLENGSTIAGDTAGRGKNYELVQELARRFKAHTGSIICADLLGLAPSTPVTTQPEERTPEYYRKRPCVETVGLACRIYAEYLNESAAE